MSFPILHDADIIEVEKLMAAQGPRSTMDSFVASPAMSAGVATPVPGSPAMASEPITQATRTAMPTTSPITARSKAEA